MDEKSCSGCEGASRRDFIVDALRAGAAVVAALGLNAANADAMPVRVMSALRSVGSDKTYPIPATDGVNIDKDNDVIVARTGKKVYGFVLACPHQNTALRWQADENRFQCPKHKSTYTPDGVFIEGRATRSMDRYAVKHAGNNIEVDIDKVYQEDTDKNEWQQAVITLP